MTELTMVEWGGGSGFALHERPGRPRPPAPFIAAAESLIRFPAVQPDERTGDPRRFPIWCLVHVEVEEVGPHWCFIVQGRDGAFGRAGSCQFLFVGARFDPSEVWLYGIERIDRDGRLCEERQQDIPFYRPAPAQLVHPLSALLADQDRVPLAGDPLAVATDIAMLLYVLPLAVIRSRIWATFLLKRPVLEEKPVVSGHWPAELDDNSRARGIRDWLGEVPATPARHSERVADALHWIAMQAANNNVLREYRDQPDMVSFVDAVIRDELGIRVADIPGLLASGSAVLRTAKAAPVIAEWAATCPEAAIAHLVPARLAPDLAEIVFDGLLRAHDLAGDGGNPVRFPPAVEGAYPGWHDYLAAALKRRLPARQERIAFVRDSLLAPGRPLAKPGAIERAAVWLGQFGVSPDDPTITIFPVSVDSIVVTLKRPNGTLSARQLAFLRDAEQPRANLHQILGTLRYINPRVADQLLATRAEREQRVWLLGEIATRNRTYGSPIPAADWVGELTALRRKDAAVIVEGMYGYLADTGELTDELLDAALRVYADLPETPPTQRKLLIEAGARLAGRRAAIPAAVAPTGDFGPTGSLSTMDSYDDQGPQTWSDRGSVEQGYHPPADPHPPAHRQQPARPDQQLSPALWLALVLGVGFTIVFVILQIIAKQG